MGISARLLKPLVSNHSQTKHSTMGSEAAGLWWSAFPTHPTAMGTDGPSLSSWNQEVTLGERLAQRLIYSQGMLGKNAKPRNH